MLSILSIALEHENPLALASELSQPQSYSEENETRATFDLHFTLVSDLMIPRISKIGIFEDFHVYRRCDGTWGDGGGGSRERSGLRGERERFLEEQVGP